MLPFLLAELRCSRSPLARPLNAVAMGDDTARALGANLNRTRALSMLAATVLCGAATAACGPIVFVGLMVPHQYVRSFTGPDLRWILPYATDPVARAAAGRRRAGPGRRAARGGAGRDRHRAPRRSRCSSSWYVGGGLAQL
ncbi:Vitamin B12 import system permease protein BtuC [Streptomyces fumanus]